MIDLVEDVVPISDLRTKAAEIVARAHEDFVEKRRGRHGSRLSPSTISVRS